MNRNIKFRVWYKTENRWIETPDGLFFKYPHSTSGEYIGDFMSDPYFPQQFIGLYDKNRVGIYEGDLIKTVPLFERIGTGSRDIFKVIYQYGKFRLMWLSSGETFIDFSPNHTFNTVSENEVEIIGNIFENSNLLENTKI